MQNNMLESVAQTMNQKVAVSDRDQIIAVAGGGKRELLGKTISRQLERNDHQSRKQHPGRIR